MGNFLKDLEESKVAVNIVKSFLQHFHSKASNLSIEELERERQHEGDVEVLSDCGIAYSVEVKYDIMAQKTGNLCFETHNGKGDPTGVLSTEADEIHYVVPEENGFTLYMFDTKNLRAYLFDAKNISKLRVVKGGDRRKYTMLLVNRETLVEDSIPFAVEKINA